VRRYSLSALTLSIRQHMSAYVSIHQHTSYSLSALTQVFLPQLTLCTEARVHTSASAYVSIRPHTLCTEARCITATRIWRHYSRLSLYYCLYYCLFAHCTPATVVQTRDLCCAMRVWLLSHQLTHADVCGRMLTYADA
jgi:hypothetical protein